MRRRPPMMLGALIVGADFVIAIGQITLVQSWLASLFRNPVVLPITRFAYNELADVLYA